VLAVAFYLRAWKKQDRVRMSAAFLAMAGGMVAHHSAAPYAIFLAIHYLVAVFPSRRDRWKELASVAGVASAPLLAWFGWRLAAYGVHGALAAAAKATKAAPAESHSAGLGGRPADCGDSAGTRQRLANGTAWRGVEGSPILGPPELSIYL